MSRVKPTGKMLAYYADKNSLTVYYIPHIEVPYDWRVWKRPTISGWSLTPELKTTFLKAAEQERGSLSMGVAAITAPSPAKAITTEFNISK